MPPISASTSLCAILLHPAGHTRSPAMHNAAFQSLGLDAVYLAFDVVPEELGAAVEGARAMRARQLAISIPHKVEVMKYLDEVDDTARRIGAVNTVTRVGERLVGANTDWLGAIRSIWRARPELEGTRSVVLGAGGAARAVAYGLLERGSDVTVLNRTRERATELVEQLGAGTAGALSDLEATPYDVLVNTTSVGLRSDESPAEAAALRPESVVMDAVYDPPQTRLLRDAAARGARTVEGKWMLVYQAAEQLRLWSGAQAPIDTMAAAFDAAGHGED